MIPIFQLQLAPKSSFITLLHANTVWGQLAWQIFLEKGEEKGNEFLFAFNQKTPPFVLSDGFPEEYLPKPFISSTFIKNQSKQETIKFMKNSKEQKKQKFLSKNEYGQEPGTWKGINEKMGIQEETISKNVIDRMTNSVKDGGIFDQTEIFSSIAYFSIYFKIFDESFWNSFEIEALLKNLFEDIGFGAKKSTGKGVFETKWNKDFSFGFSEKSEGSVLLSRGVLTENELFLLDDTARYRIQTKYGKLGEQFSHSQNPFKKPLIQLLPGSILNTKNDFCGGIIKTAMQTNAQEYAFGFLLKYPKL